MYISLPQELQTAKVKSLPKETRNLVEELLAEKFGIREEVVEKSATMFQGLDPVFIEPDIRDRGRVRVGLDFRTRERMASIEISTHGPPEVAIIEAIRRLECDRIPLRNAVIIVNPRRMAVLRGYAGFNYDSFYGCKIVVGHPEQVERIEARF